jgi:superfamily II DNA or RNA helicase
LKGFLVDLVIGNARARWEGLPESIFKLLRYELSYQVAEPGVRVYMDDSGNARQVWWDGFTSLLRQGRWMPAGLAPRALRLLQKWGFDAGVVDERIRPPDADPRWSFPSSFALRDYQLEAVDAAWARGRGVIDSPPRTGKTVMMLELLRRAACRSVVTAPTIQISAQTYAKARELFGDTGDFFLLTGGMPKTRKAMLAFKAASVFIATADTAVAMPGSWWRGIECLIVDERHHQAAKSYHTINDLAERAYFRWGFTGTNYRSDAREELALEACLGETVASFTIEDMRRRRVLVPARVIFRTPMCRKISDSAKYSSAYLRGVVQDRARNADVAAAAKELIAAGRRVLILVHQIQHGKALEGLIPASRFIQAADGPEVREVIAQLDQGTIRCVIGSPVVGEGLDIPAADALVYAKARRARVTHTQDVFRVMTASPGKEFALLVDFADRHQEGLLEHSLERLRNYLALKCSVKILDTAAPKRVDGDLPDGDQVSLF